MRALLYVALLLAPLPVGAQSLRGQWDVMYAPNPAYTATVLIDSEQRATFDCPNDKGRRVQYRGYVAQERAGITMLFTDGHVVARFYCATESSTRMQCYAANHDGTISGTVLLTRVGPGPLTLRRR